jgi:predicted ATPase
LHHFLIICLRRHGIGYVQAAKQENILPFFRRLIIAKILQSVILYDARSNARKAEFYHDAAVLDACFTDETHGVAGGLDQKVKLYVADKRHE